MSIVLDDRLLIEELLVGLPGRRQEHDLLTTSYWYYRACRAAVAGGGGHLSGPFQQLGDDDQALAILSLLELRDDIRLPDPRATVPAMARLALRHPQLDLLNLEAVAAAQIASATVWLSDAAAQGVLPRVLDLEAIDWAVVPIAS